jgi:enoyl-CoA hydratase
METYADLDVHIGGDVFRIAFDDPENRNLLTNQTLSELSTVFQDAERSDCRVVVLTGNGEYFSGGGDVDLMLEDFKDESNAMADLVDRIHWSQKTIDDVLRLRKPFVTRINGNAVGHSATLALLGDISIAAEDARIGDTHTRIGYLTPVGPALWPLLTSFNTAKEFLMTGRVVSADRAADVGLVNHAVPGDELDPFVADIVDDLATGSQPAIRYTKEITNKWLRFAIEHIAPEGFPLEAICHNLADHEEAVEAFVEKREPNFPSGRDP